MRDAVAGLTRRGRWVLGAGVLLLVGAWLAGQRDLLRVAVLLLVLPLLAVLLVSRTRYRLSCARGVQPARVPVDEVATAVVRLENVSRLPSGLLLVEDAVPDALGSSPRFVLDRMEAGGHREVTYPLRSARRGRWTVGPVRVRLVDPFGLVRLPRSFHATDTVVVTPRVVPLPVVEVGGAWTGTGESRARSVASSGEDDVVPRGYRHGDDLRRVHWRATARAGELMVRQEERPWRSRATIVLDCRRPAHRGTGPHSSFEAAVSVAASAAVHLLRRGYAVRIVDADGRSLATEEVDGDLEGHLLDALAVVDTVDGSVGGLGAALRRQVGDGLLVAVLGDLGLADVERVARLRQGAGTGLAVVLDVGSWESRGDREATTARAAAAAALLVASGWRATVGEASVPVATTWSALGGGAGTPGAVPRVPTGVGPRGRP